MLTSVKAKAVMVFLFAVVLTGAQQALHDATEYAMYYKLQAYHNQLTDIWHPSGRLLREYARAHSCYVAYHLYRVRSCAAELSSLSHNLDNVISSAKKEAQSQPAVAAAFAEAR